MDCPKFSEDELDSNVQQEAPANEPEQTALFQVTSDLEQQLYKGSEMTVSSSCLLLKKFRMQHRLTETAFADLLRLVSFNGVATIEATKAAASVINSASYILKYTTLTEPQACHDKFVCLLSSRTFTV